ncbi:MAG: hypothetical protein J6D21_04010 [Clostridia bacterium]|nr:hypothetical protein [Clostridia bacterium]
MVCIFFGHREDCSLKKDALRTAVEGLVEKGVDTFYVGHQGTFDRMVLACLGELREKYPYISYAVVWAYLPSGKTERDLPLGHTVYP